MPFAPFLIPAMAGLTGPGLPTLAFRNTYVASPAGLNNTYNNVDIGNPAPDRLVVVVQGSATSNNANSQPLTLVINGVSATLAVANFNSWGQCVSIWYATVPVGNLVTVTESYGAASVSFSGIGVYSLYGLDQLSPLGTDSAAAIGVTSLSVTVPVQTSGFVIAFTRFGLTVTVANFTQNFQNNIGGGFSTVSSSDGTVTVTATQSGAQFAALAAASFR
jgi:hypothetical protein